MRLTQEVIDKIAIAMQHTKMNGETNWKDGDEIEVCLGGHYAADKFIAIHNRSKEPVYKSPPHPDFDYEKQEWKGGCNSLGRSAGYHIKKEE
tara:strand:- start:512 stop:787 length:276 start_codon:yes stop_codon:yes gene_type:complete